MGMLQAIQSQEFGGYDSRWADMEDERFRQQLARALGGQQIQLVDYSSPQQNWQRYEQQYSSPQQQQSSINPLQAYDQYQQISGLFGGGGGIGGGGLTSAGRASAVTGAPSSGAAGSSWGSTAISAAPWAALAAAIIANESKQMGDDNRGNGGWEHAGDLLTGKVLERDLERYLPHNKAGGTAKRAAMMSTPSGVVRNVKDFGSWLGGLFD